MFSSALACRRWPSCPSRKSKLFGVVQLASVTIQLRLGCCAWRLRTVGKLSASVVHLLPCLAGR